MPGIIGNVAGRHLIIDARFSEAGRQIVGDAARINEYLVAVTQVAGMTMAVPPIALEFPVNKKHYETIEKMMELGGMEPGMKEKIITNLRARDNGKLGGYGVSAVAVWVESHCALHSWLPQEYISLDLFSCKLYEVGPVIEFTKEFMKLTEMHCVIVDRFVDAPAKITQF